jgi:hypothetical protein
MNLPKPKILIAVIVILIGIWITVLGLNWERTDKFGQFGDSFGIVTAIFSSISFVFFMWAVDLQRTQLELQKDELRLSREELKLQRIELSLQRKELKQSNFIFEEQKSAIKLQQSEGTFFNLINHHGNLVQTIELGAYGAGYEGLNTVHGIYKEKLLTYKNNVEFGTFEGAETTLYHPQFLYHELPGLRVCLESIAHIINWIEAELKNKLIYHKTLYNILNPGERFILGMALTNRLIPINDKVMFPYESEYTENSSYVNSDRDSHFPGLVYVNKVIDLIVKDFKSEIGLHRKKFTLKFYHRPVSRGVILKYLGFELTYKSYDERTRGKWAYGTSEIIENVVRIDIYETLEKTIFTEYINALSQAPSCGFQLNFTLRFAVNDGPYELRHQAMNMTFGYLRDGQLKVSLYSPPPAHAVLS